MDFEVRGAPRPVPAEVSLAAYRTAQEALTNARKHAPGQPVTLRLDYEPADVTLSVVNPIPPGAKKGRWPIPAPASAWSVCANAPCLRAAPSTRGRTRGTGG